MASVDLKIILSMVDRASSGLKNIENALKGDKAAAQGVGIALSAMGAAITASIGLAVHQVSESGAEIYNLSRKTGLAVGTLSALNVVAQETGTNLKSLAIGALFMQRNAVNTPEKFTAIGVSVRDANGQFKTAAALWDETISALQRMKDPVERNAAAFGLFGRSGREMIAILSMDREAYQQMMAAAGESSAMTEEQARTAYEYHSATILLKTSVGMLVREVITALLPSLIVVLKWLREAVVWTKNFAAAHPTLTKVLIIAAAAFGVLASAIGAAIILAPGLAILIGLLGGEALTAFAGALIGLLPELIIIAAIAAGIWLIWRAIKAVIDLKHKGDAGAKWSFGPADRAAIRQVGEEPNAWERFEGAITWGRTGKDWAKLHAMQRLREQGHGYQVPGKAVTIHVHGDINDSDKFKDKVARALGPIMQDTGAWA